MRAHNIGEALVYLLDECEKQQIELEHPRIAQAMHVAKFALAASASKAQTEKPDGVQPVVWSVALISASVDVINEQLMKLKHELSIE